MDTPPWWERLGSILTWYVLPSVAIGIVIAYVALAIVWHTNPPVVPVTGRSMQPTLHAGDLVFVKGVDTSKLRKGDIIAFRTTAEMQKKYDVPPEYVHRIVAIQKSGAGYQFRTKGDNVAGPDPFWTFDRDVVGIYAGKITGAGYPILFFRSRQGWIFAAALVLVLVVYFVFGIWERRQEAIETNAVTMEQIVAEARMLRDSMAAVGGAGPRAPPLDETESTTIAETGEWRMVPAVGEQPPGAIRCSLGCHFLLPGARFDPHSGEVVDLPEPAAPEPESEPEYVPVWLREPRPHLAEYELAPAYREPEQQEFVAIPSSRALVPAPAPIDFERLEREIHEAVRTSAHVKDTMRELVGAIGEYGEHLRSHTAVMQNLAATTAELSTSTSELRQFLGTLATLLTTLAEQRPPGQD